MLRPASLLRDLGPPTESERTTIARILIRHGYSLPPPPALRLAKSPRRTW
ncbi:MAG: hypothetical protein SFV20_06510 [Sphingopyxis sp.]|nr:hypothetical protein [Sphingopyxis sp.]